MSVTGLSGVFGFHRQAGVDQLVGTPYNGADDDSIQSVTINGVPTGGTFKLKFRGQTTGTIPYNAIGSVVQTALEALSNVAPTGADLTVAGIAGGPYTITFVTGGAYGGQPVGVEVAEASTLTGGTNVAIVVETTTPGGSWYWIPAASVNFQPNQIVQAIPPEVGGVLFSRGSYKGGVSGQGQVMFMPRGGLGMAELFYGFTGTMLVNTAVAATYAAGTANKLTGDGTNGIALGNFKYRFVPENSASAELPWYTLIRNVGGKFVERYGDGRIGNFAFDLAATGLLNVDASFVSRKCGNVAYGAGATSVGAQVAGNGIPFQAVDATLKLDSIVAGAPGPVVSDVNQLPTRLNIGFANQLSANEFVVGSFFLQDITNLARSANITFSVYLKNEDLYAKTYAHGADIVGADAAWSSEVWKGGLELTLVGGPIAATADDYTIEVTIPEMDYMATPISLAGNNLVEYQLTTNVVLSQTAGVNPFEIEYTTDENVL